VPIVLESGSLNLLEPSGLSRPAMGLLFFFGIYRNKYGDFEHCV
jgi:hypothetical protein